jgi:fido (protein-threonine AMPylation protein)
VAGNQFGTWQIFFSKETGKVITEINISHPFEDYSGFVWRNWPDNLAGISIRSKNPEAKVTRIL